jgi:hypothetical protein
VVDLLKKMCNHPFSKLRKPLAAVMHKLAEKAQPAFHPQLKEIMVKLLNDREDVVRVEVIRTIHEFTKLTKESPSAYLPLVMARPSWRVELTLL